VARKDAIEAEGRIVDILAATLFRVELPNGHRLLAHVTGRRRLEFQRLALGESVKVEMSPYDLSKGSIVALGE
jgi:translation initiation factor IF-1